MYGCCSDRTTRLRRTLSGYAYPVGSRNLSGVRDVIRDAAIAAAGSGAAQLLSGHPRRTGLGQGWETLLMAAGTSAYQRWQEGQGPLVDPATRCPGMPPPDVISAIWANMPPERRQYHELRFRKNNRGFAPQDEQHLWSGAYGGSDCLNKGDPQWLEEIKRDEQRFAPTNGNGAGANLPAKAAEVAGDVGRFVPWIMVLGLVGAALKARS